MNTHVSVWAKHLEVDVGVGQRVQLGPLVGGVVDKQLLHVLHLAQPAAGRRAGRSQCSDREQQAVAGKARAQRRLGQASAATTGRRESSRAAW